MVLQTSAPEGVAVSLKSDCPNPSNAFTTCSNVTEADVVRFTATFRIGEDVCNERGGGVAEAKISLAGFSKDVLDVTLVCEECKYERTFLTVL